MISIQAKFNFFIQFIQSWLYAIYSSKKVLIQASSLGGGGLVYLVDEEDVPFFRVSSSPIFLEQGIKVRTFFLELLVNRHIYSRAGYYFSNTRFDFTVLLISPNLFNFLTDFGATC